MKNKESKIVGAVAGILSLVCMEVLRKTGCLTGWNELERVVLAIIIGWGALMLTRRIKGPEKTNSPEGPVGLE